MSIDKLENIVNKYNTYYSTIKMKPADVKPSTYIKSNKQINYQNCKFKSWRNRVRISKYQSTFPKGYVSIGLKKFL